MMNAHTNFTPAGFYGFPYQGPIQGGSVYPSTLNPDSGYTLASPMNSLRGMPPVQSFQLSNGSRGICQQMPQTEIAEVTLQLPLGAGNAAARLLLKEALLKGSLATKDFLQEKAGQNILVSASPGGEKLLVNLLGPSGKEGEMLQLALQLTKNPILDPATFRTLKEDLLQNLKKGLINPEIGLNDRLRQEFYGSQHPYGKTLPQVIQEVEGMGFETLQAYLYQASQQTQQATMMMISPLPQEAQVGMMQNCIAQNQWYPNPYGTGLQPIPSTPPVQWSFKADKPILVPNESVERASVQRMWRAPSLQDPDYPAFLVITKMLGGMSGGFFKVLRTEKGLVYGTQQGLENHPFGSLYLVNAEIDLDKAKIKDALKGFDQVIQELVQGPLDPGDLRSHQKEILLQLEKIAESPESLSNHHLERLSNDFPPLSIETITQRIQQLTPQDIQRVAHKIFNPQSPFCYQVTGITAPAQILAQTFK